MFSEQGPHALRDCYRSQGRYKASGFQEASSVSKTSFTDLVKELLDEEHHVSAVPVWIEVDPFEEY